MSYAVRTCSLLLSLIFSALMFSGSALAQNAAQPKVLTDVGIDQKLNDQVPGNLTFKDDNGATVRLSDYYGKRPIVLCGDGAFQMTGAEIAQSRVNGTKPIVLVMNNGGWGIFRPVVKLPQNDLWERQRWKVCSGSGRPRSASRAATIARPRSASCSLAKTLDMLLATVFVDRNIRYPIWALDSPAATASRMDP